MYSSISTTVETKSFLAEFDLEVTYDFERDGGEMVIESFAFSGDIYFSAEVEGASLPEGEDISEAHPRRIEVEGLIRRAIAEGHLDLVHEVQDDLDALAESCLEHDLGYPDDFEYRGF